MQSHATRSAEGENVSFVWTIFQGLQQLLSCVGATVLAPILMGIPPNMALLTSGIGTIPYVLVTKVPIFLGSSFAYIAAIALVMEQGSRAEVAGGIIAAGILNIIVGIIVMRRGHEWIGKIIPPVVNANVLIAIGLVLTPVAVGNMSQDWTFGIITIAVVLVLGLAFKRQFFVTGLPLFLGIVGLYLFSLLTGRVDTSLISEAQLFVAPEVFLPVFSVFGVMTIVWPTIATIAENYADLQAIGVVFDEELDNKLGKSFLMDGVADILSMWGNPSTPYNESVGATQIALNQHPYLTRKQFIPVVLVAAGFAILAGVLGFTTPLINSIPTPIIGGVFWVILGIIALLGLRLLSEHKVDLMKIDNILITAVMTLVWLAGAKGAQFLIWEGLDVGAIAACAIVGILANQLKRFGNLPNVTLLLAVYVWILIGGLALEIAVYLFIMVVLIIAGYILVQKSNLDFGNRYIQLPLAVVMTLVVALIISV